MGQQQVQQPGASQGQKQKRKGFSRRQRLIATIVVALIVALAIAAAQVLSGAKIIPDIWATISNAIVGAFGMICAFFALIPLLFPSDDPQLQTPPQPPSPPVLQPSIPSKPLSGNITGSFPPTDPKTIQQRQKLVEQVYTELTKPDINCIVLTGIGGIGKSTVAALVYNYAEEQRKGGKGPFTAEALWITVEEATATFAYLAETIAAILDKPIPDLGKLPSQNQAAALFNVLNTIDHPCLIVINQFENLLDSQTGQATDPALGEWLDILNSRLCRCRVLLTSRPMPRGTRKYLATYMQVLPVEGLKIAEGVELLRSQGVHGTDSELEVVVKRCEGHAYALVLLIALVRDDNVSLATLLKDPALWAGGAGEVATNLLDAIYKQLNDGQRELLRAFSVYRVPVPLNAAQAVVTKSLESHISSAFKVLRTQYLIQSPEQDRYQLHAIVADYVQDHFDERDEQANQQALRAAHARAAQYYVQYAGTSCPPRDKRRNADDVKPLIEAFWQYCQAGQWREAYDLAWQEGVFADLKDWGSNAILLEQCQLLLPLDNWQPQPWQESDIYYYLGRAYEVLGQKKRAIEYYERALEIDKEEKNRQGEGAMLNNLGGVYNALGKKQEALSYYEQALVIKREVGDRGGEGVTFWNIGALYFEQHRYDIALASLLLARDIFEEVQSPSRDSVQSWIDDLREESGQQQFATLLAQVEPQASQIIEQALHEGL